MGSTNGVAPAYYVLTHRVVSHLTGSGLENLAKNAHIPLEELRKFKRTKNMNHFYMPRLYDHFFEDMTCADAKKHLDERDW